MDTFFFRWMSWLNYALLLSKGTCPRYFPHRKHSIKGARLGWGVVK
jgi:hypothetical protein